jgi:hypothetical protein
VTEKKLSAELPTSDSYVSVETAARFMGLTSSALRRTLERRARNSPEGTIEVCFDGIYARKLGRLWRVRFSPAWLREVAR